MNGNAMFFDSMDGDRIYDAADFREWLHRMFSEGVSLNDFFTTPAGGLKVNVPGGYTHIRGACKTFTTDTVLTLSAAGSLPRIDSVVLELDIPAKAIELKIMSGSAAENPEAPELVRTDDVWQLQLCTISVKPGTTELTQGDIDDTRMDRSVCGYLIRSAGDTDMTAVLEVYREQVRTIIEETIDDFDAWFEETKEAFPPGLRAYIEGMIEDAPKRRQEITDILDGCESKLAELNFEIAQAAEHKGGTAGGIVQSVEYMTETQKGSSTIDSASSIYRTVGYAFMVARVMIKATTSSYYDIIYWPKELQVGNGSAGFPVTVLLLPCSDGYFRGSIDIEDFSHSVGTRGSRMHYSLQIELGVYHPNASTVRVTMRSQYDRPISGICIDAETYRAFSAYQKTDHYHDVIELTADMVSVESAVIVYNGKIS